MTKEQLKEAAKALDEADVPTDDRHYICFEHGDMDCPDCAELIANGA